MQRSLSSNKMLYTNDEIKDKNMLIKENNEDCHTRMDAFTSIETIKIYIIYKGVIVATDKRVHTLKINHN